MNDNRETSDDASSNEAEGFRFTLRTLLAAFWVVAAFVVTGRFDGGTVVYVGIPVAALGFVLINGTKINPWPRRIVLSWAMLGLWNCYGCPRVFCPIELPSSASKQYVENVVNILGYYHAVRFEAPVADCQATAERIQRKSAAEHRYSIAPPIVIDEAQGLLPNRGNYAPFHNWWMEVEAIRKGLYYQPSGGLMPTMWIDTERGLFYLLDSD